MRRRQNENARNRELSGKLEIYFGDPNTVVPVVTSELNGFTEWRPKNIIDREQRLLAIVRSVWRLDSQKAESAPSINAMATRKPVTARAMKFFAGS